MNDAILTKPEKRHQKWGTPPCFTEAIARRFGRIDFDLAASADNTTAPAFFSERDDSLVQDWADIRNEDGDHSSVAFLNPEFKNLDPWAAKVAACNALPRWTLMLVPASVGSLWWARHVVGKAYYDGIPRLQFVGAPSMFMKDLALVIAGFGITSGCGYWDWRKQP
jgi:phage N-6-adenine-methyltransferase